MSANNEAIKRCICPHFPRATEISANKRLLILGQLRRELFFYKNCGKRRQFIFIIIIIIIIIIIVIIIIIIVAW